MWVLERPTQPRWLTWDQSWFEKWDSIPQPYVTSTNMSCLLLVTHPVESSNRPKQQSIFECDHASVKTTKSKCSSLRRRFQTCPLEVQPAVTLYAPAPRRMFTASCAAARFGISCQLWRHFDCPTFLKALFERFHLHLQYIFPQVVWSHQRCRVPVAVSADVSHNADGGKCASLNYLRKNVNSQ